MPGDYTRFTHKPSKRYAAVLDQQGRVQLDADQNERSDIFRRRVRVQAVDTFGSSAVSRFSTPDAFRITGAALNIGVGRMYVDGLLAEIFAGENFTYATQPFFPDPPPLNTIIGPNGIVYLDVWEREITYVQDPELLEKALGGPDTTTRIQTVWQVKVEGTQATPNCDVDLDALFPPSGGRLSSRAQAAPPSDDPCILSPTGGFRGLENRLYRVEIHRGGSPATALFKWSRDNASVVSVVENIVLGPQAQLVVSRIGRDSVLRFKVGDWVEVRDDHREWMGEPGEMARINAIDEENRTITLDRALGGRPFGVGAQLSARHTNLVRWDQQNDIVVEAGQLTGLVAVSNSFIPLEDGVEVSFAGSAGQFHVGDFWVFAARTVDGTVEELNQEPPRGIIHHFSQLATVTGLGPGGTPTVVQDCRPLWPPDTEGCCTVVVQPGESIQAALDSLPNAGGCVCLKTGIHPVANTIVIQKSNVIMHGESIGARVVAAPGTGLFGLLRIQNCADVMVEDIRFEAGETRESTDGIVTILGAEEITLRECILQSAFSDPQLSLIGVRIEKCNRVLVERNQILQATIGILVGGCRFIEILENLIAVLEQGRQGILIRRGSGPYRVENNEIVNHLLAGITLDDRSAIATISYNQIFRRSVGQNAPEKLFAIDTRSENTVVVGNYIDLKDPFYGGVRVRGSHTRVATNRIESFVETQAAELCLGILVQTVDSGIPIHHVDLVGNILTGRQDAIVVRGGPSKDAIGVQILENLIEGDGQARPRLGIFLEDATDSVVLGNQIRGGQTEIALVRGSGNQIVENRLTDGIFGVIWALESALKISGNTIENTESLGLFGLFTESLMCDHNRLEFCGFNAVGAAALLLVVTNNFTLESCHILNSGRSRDGATTFPNATFGLLAGFTREGHISGNRIAAAPNLNPALEHRAAFLLSLAAGNVELLDNVAIGVGRSRLIDVQIPSLVTGQPTGKITFSNNRCEHFGVVNSDSTAFGTVGLQANHLSVMGNQIRADQRNFASFNFAGSIRLTATGNITSAFWANIPAGAQPAPLSNFNFIAVF